MNKCLTTIIFFIYFSHFSIGQDRRIDLLEVLYSQQHHTKVIRKANKLLAMPAYDYSGMPTFYKSLATFKLLGDSEWSGKNRSALTSAIALYDEFLSHSKSEAYIKSHYFEIAELKKYLINLENEYRVNKNINQAKQIDSFTKSQLKNITSFGVKIIESDSVSKKDENNEPTESVVKNQNRNEMVAFAKKYIGTPYLWAGSSPNGFDCSGYIGYIYNNYGITVPRSAAAQKEMATPIKDSEASMGDLVFFKTGSKITHVGLVISNPNEPLTMIHSSSSKGIITTKVHASAYWSKKYAGLGRILP